VLDGCPFVTADTLWFCTVREGLTGIHWFAAQFNDGKWTNWEPADFDPAFDVGEFHIHGQQLYYHSSRDGGRGGLDIWMLTKDKNGMWSDPVNVAAVNSSRGEGWPAISPNGTELWFSRDYGVWRSVWGNDGWMQPVLMFSPLAGEAAIDSNGNVFFTHHFYDETGETMLDADIYVAYRK
ncbi:MAG: hypothetical protein V2J07_05595, partial [Anaerolineae bacterium]|jgi:hypothetical protein|nr:hypothetical protein [Anaerolineae bacterium]